MILQEYSQEMLGKEMIFFFFFKAAQGELAFLADIWSLVPAVSSISTFLLTPGNPLQFPAAVVTHAAYVNHITEIPHSSGSELHIFFP